MTAMVIIGAGQAGGRAALTLREQGHDGTIVLLGSEPAAPYERPPLSKSYLRGGRAAEAFTFAKAEALAAAGIDFRPRSTVATIDRARRRVGLEDGSELGYTRLLIATGREPRRLPVPAEAADRVLVLRDLADADRLREALAPGACIAVIGGGFLGLEVAATARGMGVEVTVIELASRLLSRGVPAPLAGFLGARHEAAGITLHLGRRLERIEATADGVLLRLDDGARIEAGTALVAIGADPRTFVAEASGLAVDRGIVVDATLATADPDIFAAGDACAFPHPVAPGLLRLESWRNADTQGAVAARNMLGAGEAYRELPWFWSDQHELTLQIAGFPDQAERTVERDVGPEARLLFHLAGEGRLVGVSGVGPAALGRELRLGQLMVGRGLAPHPSALADPTIALKSLLR